MRFNYSSKREQYYDKAMQLYFEEGLCGTHICKDLPISRAILYKWISIFVEENPQVASMRRVKAVKKAPGQTLEIQLEEFPRDVQELQFELNLKFQFSDANLNLRCVKD